MKIPKIPMIDLTLKGKRGKKLNGLLLQKFIAIGQHVGKNSQCPDFGLFDLMLHQCYLYHCIKQKNPAPFVRKHDKKLIEVLKMKLHWLEHTNNYSLDCQKELYFTKMQIAQGIMVVDASNDRGYLNLLYIEKVCLKMRNRLKNTTEQDKIGNLIKIFYICQEIKAINDMNKQIEYISRDEALTRTKEKAKDYDYLLGLLNRKLTVLKQEINSPKLTTLEKINMEIELWELEADIEAKTVFRDIYRDERANIIN